MASDPIREALRHLINEAEYSRTLYAGWEPLDRLEIALDAARAALAAPTESSEAERLLACATQIEMPDGWYLCMVQGQWNAYSDDGEHHGLGTDPLAAEKRLREILAERAAGVPISQEAGG